MGTGILHGRGSKQKMNSRSSNETEVIRNSEYLPFNIWFTNFLTAQGYKPTTNSYYQDNEGVEKMARNGCASCTGRSRHIDIKYFWITDCIKQGKLDIKRCPTDRMVADYFTKPLQGKQFHRLRRVIMGYDHMSTVTEEAPVPSVPTVKERVGDDGIMKESSTVILTDGKTVEKPPVTRSTYAEVVAEGSAHKTEVLPHENTT